MKTLLLTGATGFVGSALLTHLCAHTQYEVRVATRSEPAADLAPTFKSFNVGDFSSSPDWGEALAGVDCVVHMAGRAHVMAREKDALSLFRRANTDATLELARHAIEKGVQRFVFISSIGVNGAYTPSTAFDETCPANPHADYAISKFEAEESLKALCDSHAMELVIIRPPLVYAAHAPGNFQRLLKLASTGVPLPFGGVRNSRSMVALENLVDFISLCMVHPRAANELFLVSDGIDISTPDLVRCIGRGMGRRIVMLTIPDPMMRLMASCIGKQNLYTQLCRSLTVNSNKARQLLGWIPPVTTEHALVQAGREYINARSIRS